MLGAEMSGKSITILQNWFEWRWLPGLFPNHPKSPTKGAAPAPANGSIERARGFIIIGIYIMGNELFAGHGWRNHSKHLPIHYWQRASSHIDSMMLWRWQMVMRWCSCDDASLTWSVYFNGNHPIIVMVSTLLSAVCWLVWLANELLSFNGPYTGGATSDNRRYV